MKKLLVAATILVALLATGCASTGGSAPPPDLPPYSVDLSQLQPGIRNTEPFPRNYADFMVLLPEIDVDLTQYRRITIRARMFDENGEEIIHPTHGNGMVSVILAGADEFAADPDQPRFRQDGHSNLAVKEFNLASDGRSGAGAISSNAGVRTSRVMPQNPTGVLFQNASPNVKYIEITAIVFHNSRAGLD